MTLIGPYLAACLLLVTAGVAKLVRPAPAASALATVLGARWRRSVRAIGAIEIAAGIVGIAHPSAAGSGIVAAIYLSFAAFVVLARRRGGQLASCGCFGVPDTPATRLHVVINLGGAAAAITVAAAARPGWIPTILHGQPAGGLPLALAAALIAALAAIAMTLLPRLQAARGAVS